MIFVVDLGCGDGRVLITAAKKYGARGFGVDAERCRVESEENARLAGVNDLVSFKLQDAARVDLGEATVITLYLVHWSVNRLGPAIRKQAKSGTRIVSHNFPITEWEATQMKSSLTTTAQSTRCTCG